MIKKQVFIILERTFLTIKCQTRGPDGGKNGGKVVVTGTPEEVAKCEKSYTGEFLKKILAENK